MTRSLVGALALLVLLVSGGGGGGCLSGAHAATLTTAAAASSSSSASASTPSTAPSTLAPDLNLQATGFTCPSVVTLASDCTDADGRKWALCLVQPKPRTRRPTPPPTSTSGSGSGSRSSSNSNSSSSSSSSSSSGPPLLGAVAASEVCEIPVSCRNAPGVDLRDINCDSFSIVTVQSIPSETIELVLSFNAIREFKPQFNDTHANLRTLRLAWNLISSIDDISIPSSVKSMSLAFNRLKAFSFTQALSNCLEIDISNNPIKTITYEASGVTDLKATNISVPKLSAIGLPPSLSTLVLDSNPNMTWDNFTAPVDLRSFSARESKITEIGAWDFSSSTNLRSILLAHNKITQVAGIQFPPSLEKLELNGSNITCFVITEANVPTLQALRQFFVGSISQSSCPETAVQNATVKTLSIGSKPYQFMVLNDATFQQRFYSHRHVDPSSSPSPDAAPKTKSGLSTMMIVLLALIGVLVAIGLAVFGRILYVRKQRNDPDRAVENDLGYRLSQDGSLTKGSEPTVGTDSADATEINSRTRRSEPVINYDVRSDPELANYRIPLGEVKKGHVLAKGGHGVLYLATLHSRTVVMKQILPERARDAQAIRRFMDEIRLCARLEHPNIVGFVGLSWTTLLDLAVIVEYMPNGDLGQFLKTQRGNRAAFGWSSHDGPYRSKLLLAVDIAEALVYLHSPQPAIVHRDLKARNVLLGTSWDAKLTDFGVSREVSREAAMTAEVGTVAWIAPEVLTGQQYSERADIYSFGVLMAELDTCDKPYAQGIQSSQGVVSAPSNARIALAVTVDGVRPEFHQDCPPDILSLAMSCMVASPHQRPSALEVLHRLRKLLG